MNSMMSVSMENIRRALGDAGLESLQALLVERVEKLRDDLEKADAADSASVAKLQGQLAGLRDLAADLRGDRRVRPQKTGGYF